MDIFNDLELNIYKYKVPGKVLLTGDFNSQTDFNKMKCRLATCIHLKIYPNL